MTGAGGPAGIAVVRAVLALGCKVVAVDANSWSVGLQLADHGAVVPLSYSPGFVDAVGKIAEQYQAKYLVATVAEELPSLRNKVERLSDFGLATWLPDVAAIDSCTDKWLFFEVATALGIPTPATALGMANEVPGPWIVKPRWGRGSRHVYSVDHQDELAVVIRWVPDPIVQTRASGNEFTVDCLVDHDLNLVGAVPRWRVETKAGISTRGETFSDASVLGLVERLLVGLKLQGPSNVQGFVQLDGQVVITEVNPRFSGGLPLSLAAGADLVGEYLRGMAGLPIRPERLIARDGVTMARYHEELFGEATPASPSTGNDTGTTPGVAAS